MAMGCAADEASIRAAAAAIPPVSNLLQDLSEENIY